MIVKRPSKLEMPDLKRCDFDDSGFEEDDYGCSVHPKKQRTATLCSVPVDSLGQCDNDAPRSSSFTEGSSMGEETESDSKNNAANSRKTSRGRVPVLPSRFNDSVIGSWKDNKSKFADIESGLHEIYLKRRDNKKNKVENFGYDTYLVKKEFKEEKISLPSYRYHPYCQDAEEDGMGSFGLNDYVYSKPSINKPLIESKEYIPLPQPVSNGKGMVKVQRANTKQKKAAYGPEDFSLGDIVWAKSGKRYPAWPAIVIDPMLQAPEAVLSSCIPGAICVMYFGYSKNGKQRVSCHFVIAYRLFEPEYFAFISVLLLAA